MKTCIKYWGGKQQLSELIKSYIPSHSTYCEPFFGGGAVFFSKIPSKNEVINDLNDNMVNFYRVLKKDFEKLQEEVECSLHSEYQYRHAKELYNQGFDENNILRAWAVFILSHQSFSGQLGASWAFHRTRNQASYFNRVKKNFTSHYERRLENVQIFNRDALNVISNIDSEDTFHFIDPPYFNSDCGHYGGYTEKDFIKLLELLKTVKGKFLLTTYPSDVLHKHSRANGWLTIKNEMHLAASKTSDKKKIEVFTMNYDPKQNELTLFG